MSVEARPPTKIYTPTSLNELLAYYRDHPQGRSSSPEEPISCAAVSTAVQVAGGELIDLGRVPEFAHISRTERYMEIGPAVPISKIMATGRHVMPRSLYTALGYHRGHGPAQPRYPGREHLRPGSQTFGYPVLLLLDVRLELRRREAAAGSI